MYVLKPVSPEPPLEFFVAPDGDDRWSGRLPAPTLDDGPFATIERAQRAVRALKRKGGLTRPVRVVLRGGTYFLRRSLEFGPQDSGTPECPVTYTAATGETAVVSGGQRVTGFRLGIVQGRRCWVVNLPENWRGWKFRQLFVNGERRARTRLPRRGFYRIERVLDYRPGKHAWVCPMRRFGYRRGDIARWRNLRDVEVVALTRWIENRLPVVRVDTRRRIVTFDRASRHALLDEAARGKGTVYWVENVFEALEAPGHWYHDRRRGKLFYLPKRGERMGEAEVIAPHLPQIIRVVGRPRRKVEYLRFENLCFAHAEWDLPSGWPSSVQAAWEVPGAVFFAEARNCVLHRCVVERVGGYGVEIGEGCLDIEVSRCRITDLGAGGVKCGHDSARTTIADCEIAHGGRLFPSAVGIWIGHSPGNKVLHNHVHDFFYTGISVGWVWGYAESRAVGNIIEHNHVHDIGQGLLSDMGGIYTLGVSPGTRIRYNVFHDVNCRGYGGWGIYTDEGSTDILIEKNLAWRCNSSPFHQHYGCENLIVNNIFAFGRDNQIERSRLEPHISFIFRRNIVYYDRGNLLGRRWETPNAVFDHNLYWDASGRPVTFAGRSFAEWQALWMDAGSLIADPLFVDPKRGDFRLRRGSPARQIGFEEFDLADVGPRPYT